MCRRTAIYVSRAVEKRTCGRHLAAGEYVACRSQLFAIIVQCGLPVGIVADVGGFVDAFLENIFRAFYIFAESLALFGRIVELGAFGNEFVYCGICLLYTSWSLSLTSIS